MSTGRWARTGFELPSALARHAIRRLPPTAFPAQYCQPLATLQSLGCSGGSALRRRMLRPGDALPQGSQRRNSMSKDGQRDLREKRECDRPTEAAPIGGDLSRALRCPYTWPGACGPGPPRTWLGARRSGPQQQGWLFPWPFASLSPEEIRVKRLLPSSKTPGEGGLE